MGVDWHWSLHCSAVRVAQMSMAQHLQVRFLLVVYGNQSYVLYSPRDDHARSCGFRHYVTQGEGDVRVQSYGSPRDALRGGGDSHVRHYGFCLDLHCCCGY